MKLILAALSGILCVRPIGDGDISLFCYWLVVAVYWIMNYTEAQK